MILALRSILESALSSSRIKEDFGKYIQSQQVSKWIILSDFCIGDAKKPNDAVTFVFIPYVINIEHLLRLTGEKLKTDFKKLSDVNEGIVSFLKLPRIFSITILLERNRKLFTSDGHGRRQEKYIASVNEAISKFQGRPIEKKFRQLKQYLMRGSPNLKLLDDIILVAFLGGYFSSILAEYSQGIEKVGWFPDRDNLITAHNQIIYDLMNQNFYFFSPTLKEGIMSFGKMENNGVGWYDNLNRIPDYLVGTMADLNIRENLVSHQKHVKMLADVFADSKQHIVLKMYLDGNGIKFAKVDINKK